MNFGKKKSNVSYVLYSTFNIREKKRKNIFMFTSWIGRNRCQHIQNIFNILSPNFEEFSLSIEFRQTNTVSFFIPLFQIYQNNVFTLLIELNRCHQKILYPIRDPTKKSMDTFLKSGVLPQLWSLKGNKRFRR